MQDNSSYGECSIKSTIWNNKIMLKKYIELDKLIQGKDQRSAKSLCSQKKKPILTPCPLPRRTNCTCHCVDFMRVFVECARPSHRGIRAETGRMEGMFAVARDPPRHMDMCCRESQP